MADSGCEDTVPAAPITGMEPHCKLPEESDASMRARLFNSLSQSFPHSQLYKALHGEADLILGGDNAGDSEDDDDSLYGDHLSNSCFASLRMDRRDSDDFDDDLRSLEWLQSEDLLKNIGGEILDQDDVDGSPVMGEQKENEDIKPDLSLLHAAAQQSPHLPYMPHKHVNSKPPYSFSCLIFMAVEASPYKRLPVKDIYHWILTQFPYFQNAPTGWKNSVRHNLSLNKCFKKVEKDKGQSIGKGSLWCIDPAYRPNLLQALRKTPYHPYHQLQMTSTQHQNYMLYQSLPGSGRTVLPLTQRPVPNTVSPHLFPFLSRRLAQTTFDVDSEMKDVAQTLVALKSSIKKESPDNSANEDVGPTWRHHKRPTSSSASQHRSSSPVIVTDHPSLDHAYSSSRILEDDSPSNSSSSSSSIDEEYDFGDADEECESDFQSDMDWDDSDDKDEVDGDVASPSNSNVSHGRGKLKIDIPEENEPKKGRSAEDIEEDEQKKLHEGASALLNLAGFLIDQSRDRFGSLPPMLDRRTGGSRDSSTLPYKKRPFSRGRPQKRSHEDEEEDEDETDNVSVTSTPSKSKRKNAGSNAKYKEYTLGKIAKSSSKSRSNSSLSPGSGSSKKKSSDSSISPGIKSGKKASTSLAKTKANGNHINNVHKAVKKKSPQAKKLKLSKAFGKKSDTQSEANSARKTAMKNPFVRNGLNKRVVTPTAKMKDSSILLQSSEKTKSTSHASMAQETVPKTNIEPPKTALHNGKDKTENGRTTPTQLALSNNNNNNNNDNNNLSKNGAVSLPTASGDAPTILQVNTVVKLESESANSPERYTPPPTINAALVNGDSHKSPHFTRFSKKKSARS